MRLNVDNIVVKPLENFTIASHPIKVEDAQGIIERNTIGKFDPAEDEEQAKL
jgi:hypothetical protein